MFTTTKMASTSRSSSSNPGRDWHTCKPALRLSHFQKNWKPRFFTIWTGQAFSLLGSSLVQFALVWWLTQKTGSATILATATLVAMLPQILLGPIAGTLVDRWNRRVVMMVADSLIAGVSLVLVYLFATGIVQVWHIFLVSIDPFGGWRLSLARHAGLHLFDGARQAAFTGSWI